MEKGYIQVYCGTGKGKTTAALGQAIHAASEGKSVIIIQFLKARNENEISFISRLEPEIKLFRFERSEEDFDELSEAEKTEEIQNIRNGLNFAKKVLVTEECQVLVLDELLGLFDRKIVTYEDLETLFDAKSDETELILTGIHFREEIMPDVDNIYRIETVKSVDSGSK